MVNYAENSFPNAKQIKQSGTSLLRGVWIVATASMYIIPYWLWNINANFHGVGPLKASDIFFPRTNRSTSSSFPPTMRCWIWDIGKGVIMYSLVLDPLIFSTTERMEMNPVLVKVGFKAVGVSYCAILYFSHLFLDIQSWQGNYFCHRHEIVSWKL